MAKQSAELLLPKSFGWRPSLLLLFAAVIVSAAPGVGAAAEKTITGPLTAVSSTKRTIQVGDKELEVSRKSAVKIDGKIATISDLKSGQSVTVTYDDDLDIVRTITVGMLPAVLNAPELIQLSELGSGRFSMPFWVSNDGLRVYWEGGETAGTISMASRDSISSLFSEPKSVLKGRHPTLTQDALEMIHLAPRADSSSESSLHSAVRDASNTQFGRPKEIAELRSVAGSPKGPSLSSDGLRLTFVSAEGDKNSAMVTKRDSRQEPWKKPVPIAFADQRAAGNLTWVQLSEDGLTLISAEEGAGTSRQKGNFVVWRRAAESEPFKDHEYITVRGLPALAGRCPRYAEDLKELYFTRSLDQKWLGIWVVKGISLDKK